VTSCRYELREVEGKGRGVFLSEDVKAGQIIITEEAAVIGPKQTSTLVRIGPRTGRPKPEARGQRPETRGQRPETRGQRPETRGQRPEARGLGPEARGKRPEARGRP
jgi:hypothetical protein